MRGMVSVLLVSVFLSLFSFMALSVNSDYNDFKKPSAVFELKTFTSAVCEDRNDLVYCKDELFVNCNGKMSKSGEIKECNGINLDNFKASGFAVFGEDWTDPRN